MRRSTTKTSAYLKKVPKGKPLAAKTARIVCNVPEETKESLETISEETGVSITWIVNGLLTRYLKGEVKL